MIKNEEKKQFPLSNDAISACMMQYTVYKWNTGDATIGEQIHVKSPRVVPFT